MKNKIIVVASVRAKVGRTTIAVNLAKELASNNKRVLLIDLDPQADSSNMLNFNKNYSIANLFNKSKNIGDIVHKIGQSSLYILPSNIKLVQIETNFMNNKFNFRLNQVVEYLRKKFDFIIFDVPPYFGHITISSLLSSDIILSPVKIEKLALEYTKQILGITNLLEKKIKFLLTTNTNIIEKNKLEHIGRNLINYLCINQNEPMLLNLKDIKRATYTNIVNNLRLLDN